MFKTALRIFQSPAADGLSYIIHRQGAAVVALQFQRWVLCRTFSSAPMATPIIEDYSEDDGRPPSAFDILGVPARFDLNEAELKKKYRALMSQSHPDRQQTVRSTTTSQHQEASSITHSYDVLTHPVKRATHLLEIMGKPLEESKQMTDLEFLMNVMEIREELDQIINDHCCCCGDNCAHCDKLLKPMWRENNKRIQDTCQALQTAFAAGDLEQALTLTAQLQYWSRIEETIRAKLAHLD